MFLDYFATQNFHLRLICSSSRKSVFSFHFDPSKTKSAQKRENRENKKISKMYNPHQNGMNFPPSQMNLPSMQNLQNSGVPQNLGAQMQQPRFPPGAMQMMFGQFPPQNQFVQPVYIMDHHNQIHLINVQVMKK